MRTRLLCLVLLTTSVAASTALGQELGVRSYGLRGGVNLNPDQFNFGAHIDAGRLASRVRFQPSFELGLGNGVTLASTNFDAHYLFNAGRVRPYAGGGLGINFIDVTSGIGRGGGLNIEPVLNLVAGAESRGSGGLRVAARERFAATCWRHASGWATPQSSSWSSALVFSF